jgi:hypothetical protein
LRLWWAGWCRGVPTPETPISTLTCRPGTGFELFEVQQPAPNSDMWTHVQYDSPTWSKQDIALRVHRHEIPVE